MKSFSNIFAIDRFRVKMKTFLIILLVAAAIVLLANAQKTPGYYGNQNFKNNLKS